MRLQHQGWRPRHLRYPPSRFRHYYHCTVNRDATDNSSAVSCASPADSLVNRWLASFYERSSGTTAVQYTVACWCTTIDRVLTDFSSAQISAFPAFPSSQPKSGATPTHPMPHASVSLMHATQYAPSSSSTGASSKIMPSDGLADWFPVAVKMTLLLMAVGAWVFAVS